MGVPRIYWNQAYLDGTLLSQWDHDLPAQDLIDAHSELELSRGCAALDLGCGRQVSRVLKPGGFLVIRGSSRTKDDSFYEVSEKSIGTFFPASDFSIKTILPVRIANNAGGLTANRVTLRRIQLSAARAALAFLLLTPHLLPCE